MDLLELKKSIEREIASYVYAVPEGAVGNPMPNGWVTQQLEEMRSALVTPEWKEIVIQDTPAQATGGANPELRKCVLVADDRGGYQLYYDPITSDYVLAYSGSPPRTFNVRGDAVGCFMAR